MVIDNSAVRETDYAMFDGLYDSGANELEKNVDGRVSCTSGNGDAAQKKDYTVEYDLLEGVGQRQAAKLAVDVGPQGCGKQHHLMGACQMLHDVIAGEAQCATCQYDRVRTNLLDCEACHGCAWPGHMQAALGDGLDSLVELSRQALAGMAKIAQHLAAVDRGDLV